MDIMGRTEIDDDSDPTFKRRTINLYEWQLKEIKNYGWNRSNYVESALIEQLKEDKKQNILKMSPGVRIVTISLDAIVETTIEKHNKRGTYISFSEFARKAIENKLIRDRKGTIIQDFRNTLPEDMVYIPSENGGLPFKVRRLE